MLIFLFFLLPLPACPCVAADVTQKTDTLVTPSAEPVTVSMLPTLRLSLTHISDLHTCTCLISVFAGALLCISGGKLTLLATLYVDTRLWSRNPTSSEFQQAYNCTGQNTQA